MKSLLTVENFGGTDADNDDLLLKAFEDHQAYIDILACKRHLIVGRKGSGKTAIFRKLITTREVDFFAYGHTFSDYPWHYHERQARIGIPDFDKYTHSWKYLILMSLTKIALNQDQSLPHCQETLENLIRLESFVIDAYGSRDPDLSQVFNPIKTLRLRPHFDIDFKVLKAGISPESVPMTELPVIVQEVNAAFASTVLSVLNPAHRYFIAFDQLDLGFDPASPDYSDRLVGLLLACRDLNLLARTEKLNVFIVVFLRDDIYESLHFEDKNKMTENYASFIEWDTARAKKTLKSLMERRFSILLGEHDGEDIRWEQVFNEDRKMPGHQTKYEHIRDRTYLRPRDMIKFSNSTLDAYKERVASAVGDGDPAKIDNGDVHNARIGFSEYFLRELDDEVHKHVPDYERYLEILRVLGTWQFDRTKFEEAYALRQQGTAIAAISVLETLYNFSIIGFYRAGGRGFGGSEYIFKYREDRARFDPTSERFRIHPGLIEALGLKRS
jgi:hypothetical protein